MTSRKGKLLRITRSVVQVGSVKGENSIMEFSGDRVHEVRRVTSLTSDTVTVGSIAYTGAYHDFKSGHLFQRVGGSQ